MEAARQYSSRALLIDGAASKGGRLTWKGSALVHGRLPFCFGATRRGTSLGVALSTDSVAIPPTRGPMALRQLT